MVFVLDTRKTPLMPCSEKRARLLLERGRARVHRLIPFTIRLIDRIGGATQPLEIKLDPGSKTTGLALVRTQQMITHVLGLIELTHRGKAIGDALTQRKGFCRRRRSANLRYRKPRFHNRRRSKGWLAPSLQHRVDTIMAWVLRLQRLSPIERIAQELVRFDMQMIVNPEISGIEYQQGELLGYEVREYLLEKWQRTCAYCDATGIPLQIEHIVPRARGGSHRISNLTLACESCNTAKGSQRIEDVLANDPKRLAAILAHCKAPLRDAAAVNSTRWTLYHACVATGLTITTGSGGQTKYNRSRYGIPKTHALDAVCVGAMDDVSDIRAWAQPTLAITAMGRGAYKRTRLTKHGFPRGYLMRTKRVHGFATGDIVRATIPKGTHAGIFTGRIAVRASGSFNLRSKSELRQGISHTHCRLLQRNDGYHYTLQERRFLPGMNAEVSAPTIR